MRTEDEAAGRDCPANGSETEVSRIVTNSTRGDKRARFAGTRRTGARGGWRGEETAPEDILAYVERGTARCRDATTRSEPAAANRAHVGKNTPDAPTAFQILHILVKGISNRITGTARLAQRRSGT